MIYQITQRPMIKEKDHLLKTTLAYLIYKSIQSPDWAVIARLSKFNHLIMKFMRFLG